MPGSVSVGRRLDEALATKCGNVFQASLSKEGFCPKCGLKLVFASELPELGRCATCARPYHEGDLINSFCGDCGEPVSVNEHLKSEYGKQKDIQRLVGNISLLRQAGYLPTMSA